MVKRVGTPDQPWEIVDTTADEFLLRMLEYGIPIETSLVGVFGEKGRGSRREIPLPFHRDGDYSIDISAKHSIDVVGLYCIRDGDAITVIKHREDTYPIILKRGQGIIFENQEVLHAREGKVGNRILLRVWVERGEQ